MQDAVEVLRSKPWDAVSIGFGVRGNPAYTSVFEGLVNAVSDYVRPVPILLFQARPDGLSESAKRMASSGVGVAPDGRDAELNAVTQVQAYLG